MTQPKGTELGLQTAGPSRPAVPGAPAPQPSPLLHGREASRGWTRFPSTHSQAPRGSLAQPRGIPYECPWVGGEARVGGKWAEAWRSQENIQH